MASIAAFVVLIASFAISLWSAWSKRDRRVDEYLYAGTTNGVHSMAIGSTDNWKKLRAANPQDGLAEMVCWVHIVDGVLLAASSNGMIRWNEVSGWSHSGLNGLWLM